MFPPKNFFAHSRAVPISLFADYTTLSRLLKQPIPIMLPIMRGRLFYPSKFLTTFFSQGPKMMTSFSVLHLKPFSNFSMTIFN